jgi:hypothetical protein
VFVNGVSKTDSLIFNGGVSSTRRGNHTIFNRRIHRQRNHARTSYRRSRRITHSVIYFVCYI